MVVITNSARPSSVPPLISLTVVLIPGKTAPARRAK
jgi:hypothetical protein